MFNSTGLYKCATCQIVCAEPEALDLLRKALPSDCNGYSLADAYSILKQLLAHDDHAKQNGNGFLTGAEVAVIGGCMTRLRLQDTHHLNPPTVAADGSKSIGVTCCDRSFETADQAYDHEQEHKAGAVVKVFIVLQLVEDESQVFGVYATKELAREDIKEWEEESKLPDFPFADSDEWQIIEKEVHS